MSISLEKNPFQKPYLENRLLIDYHLYNQILFKTKFIVPRL